MDTIRWKNGARVKVAADVAHKELEKIRKKHGEDDLPEAIVMASKIKKAPLHSEFEWDDSIAAHEHRISRARMILRYIEVVYEEDTDGKHPVRFYSAERTKGPKHKYSPTKDIMQDPDRRALLLQEALNKLMQWRMQYRHLNELQIVFRTHDELLATVGEAED